MLRPPAGCRLQSSVPGWLPVQACAEPARRPNWLSPLPELRAGAQLGEVLAAVTQGLQAQCSPFLEHTLSQASASQAFDFLGGGLLAEVHAALDESLPGEAGRRQSPTRPGGAAMGERLQQLWQAQHCLLLGPLQTRGRRPRMAASQHGRPMAPSAAVRRIVA